MVSEYLKSSGVGGGGGGGEGGVTRGQFLLGMCCRPLRTPRPHLLKSLPFSNFKQAFPGATHKFKTTVYGSNIKRL